MTPLEILSRSFRDLPLPVGMPKGRTLSNLASHPSLDRASPSLPQAHFNAVRQ